MSEQIKVCIKLERQLMTRNNRYFGAERFKKLKSSIFSMDIWTFFTIASIFHLLSWKICVRKQSLYTTC